MAKKRRGHNQGSIFQRKDGRWCAVISFGYRDGRLQRKNYYGSTQKEVSDKLDDARQDLKKGIVPVKGKLTLGAYLETWLTDRVKPTRRPGTFKVYAHHVKHHLAPALGNIELTKLTPEDIERYMNGKSKSLARYQRMILATVLRQAEKRGYVTRNVAKLVDRPEVVQREATILTLEQVEVLLVALKGERFECFFRLSIMLGLRKGELLGLRWEDINFEAHTISPRYQVNKRGDEVDFVELKTKKSRRTLPLPEELAALLRDLRTQQLKKRMASKAWVDNGLVFNNNRGGTIDPSVLNRHLARILTAAGLPHCHVHDLRHNCASYLHAAGADIKTISEILGHSNIAITADLYAHVFASVKQDAINAVAKMFTARG